MKKRILIVLALYCLLFYGAWAVYELAVSDILSELIAGKALLQLIKDGIVKNLIWTLPALLLIRHFRSEVFVELREMFTAKTNWLRYLPIFAGFSLYLLAGAFLQKGTLAVSEAFGIEDVIIVLFVGLTEETVFRGWLLNATYREEKKWRCMFINAAMFLAIHFPIWIHQGVFAANFVNFGFVSVLALSILFSWTFVKSRSIWVPVVLHMYWDLLIFLFY